MRTPYCSSGRSAAAAGVVQADERNALSYPRAAVAGTPAAKALHSHSHSAGSRLRLSVPGAPKEQPRALVTELLSRPSRLERSTETLSAVGPPCEDVAPRKLVSPILYSQLRCPLRRSAAEMRRVSGDSRPAAPQPRVRGSGHRPGRSRTALASPGFHGAAQRLEFHPCAQRDEHRRSPDPGACSPPRPTHVRPKPIWTEPWRSNRGLCAIS